MFTSAESNIRSVSEHFPQRVGRLTLRLLLALSFVAAITFVFVRLIPVNATSVPSVRPVVTRHINTSGFSRAKELILFRHTEKGLLLADDAPPFFRPDTSHHCGSADSTLNISSVFAGTCADVLAAG